MRRFILAIGFMVFSVTCVLVYSASSNAAPFSCTMVPTERQTESARVLETLHLIPALRSLIEEVKNDLGVGGIRTTMIINCSNENGSRLDLEAKRKAIIEKLTENGFATQTRVCGAPHSNSANATINNGGTIR